MPNNIEKLDRAFKNNHVTLAPERSEDDLALRFAERFKNKWRHIASQSSWYRWDKRRWSKEPTLEVFDDARTICREVASKTEQSNEAKKLTSAATVAAVERMSRADRKLAATIEQFDSHDWLLNTPTGVIDLHTGNIQPHDPELYLSKMTTVGPKDDCPRWLQFLDEITGGNSELIAFLQRFCGYALTGCTHEHSLLFGHGVGANGKSVFLSTVTGILGDYATHAPIETFTASHNDRHPTELAALQGARLVTAIETEEGRAWAEARVKALTGGDPITARFMRQDFFTFIPKFKLFVVGNHKPRLKSIDEAIKRRLHLVPFEVTISPEKRDEQLAEKLKAEWPGILAWMIEGCVAWQKERLNPPDIVRDATAEYLNAEDAIEQWIIDRCELINDAFDTNQNLYASWSDWAENAGEPHIAKRNFLDRLTARPGLERKRRNHGRERVIEGIRIVRQGKIMAVTKRDH